MDVVLLENSESRFYPLTLSRPFADLRMGVFTFAERWQKLLEQDVFFQTAEHLKALFPTTITEESLNINPHFLPNYALAKAVQNLKNGQALITKDNNVIAFIGNQNNTNTSTFELVTFNSELTFIENPWHLFLFNDQAIELDYEIITQGRKSTKVSSTNGLINPDRIFIEESAVVEYSTLNASKGPIYIGNNTEIAEGSHLRGSIALCDNAKINMGSKIYGGTSIGPVCKVGGEINNSILHSYSNKGHEGFLGNSLIGQWCNLGADTNTSNMKNNYSNIKVWNYKDKSFTDTGLQFFGLLMADHGKSAIDTRFNSGTTIGFSANVFTEKFPPKLVNNFDWGGENSGTLYALDKAKESAARMMKRRGVDFNEAQTQLFEYIYKLNN